MSDRKQVEGRIGRTTERHGHCNRIFKGFTGQDIWWFETHFQHLDNSTTCFFDIGLLIRWFSRVRRGTRKTHPKDLDRCRHGVGRIHPTTATRARAGVTFQLLHFFSRHITVIPFPNSFENRNQVDIFSIEIPWSNSPTISKDRWDIHIGNGNHGTRHVLITAPDGYKSINVVTTHSCFDRIRNDIARC